MNQKRKLSICHVITTIEIGGAEKQLLVLSKKQIEDGHNVQVVYLKGLPVLADHFHRLGVTTFSLSAYSPLIQLLKLRHHLNSHSIDIVHAHLPRAEILCRSVITSECFVISRHNCEPFFPSSKIFVSTMLSRWVTRSASSVICISNSVKQFLAAHNEISKGIPVFVVHYGLDFKQNSVHRRKSNQKTKISRFIAIGRLENQKDYVTLFRALSIYGAHGHSFSIDVFGTGKLASSLEKLTKELGLESLVNWRGKVEDIEVEISKADYLIHTSLYEGFGMIFLESAKIGTPVICSDNSAAIEIFGKDYPGLFNTGDPMSLAETLERISKANFVPELLNHLNRVSAKFSVDEMWKNMKKIYYQSLASK